MRAFSDDEMHWLRDIFARCDNSIAPPRLETLRDPINVAALAKELRGWGVGTRDAFDFIEPLLRSMVREEFEATPFIQGCLDEPANAQEASGLHAHAAV